MIKNMDLNDLKFYCVNCGTIFEYSEIEKKKLPKNVSIKAVLECNDCSGTKFEVYTTRLY